MGFADPGASPVQAPWSETQRPPSHAAQAPDPDPLTRTRRPGIGEPSSTRRAQPLVAGPLGTPAPDSSGAWALGRASFAGARNELFAISGDIS